MSLWSWQYSFGKWLSWAFMGVSMYAHAEATVHPKAMLQAHNQVRGVENLPSLTWSPQLTQYAQEWAQYLARNNRCEMQHRKGKNNPLQAGENIYWSGPLQYSNGKRAVASVNDRQVVQDWASEKEYYSYKNNSCRTGEQCGHYTQIVWRNTQKVGCGAALCSDQGQIWVCNYDPPGNWQGERPY
ncbi:MULTISPECIES: CAP domain-containing protein [Vitreoscilla]|uniref:CAP domain-containing protein n=1 Tax=Vitreoscilla stercoraria TaxID=61 RepID=A0ABY4EE08_VITST|nr:MULTISPECIES: CAP domain-containing protein [Vitreoscilla]AUZ05194.2 hypothetical protein ADP71_16610 [Vitreoscilla sp. C1]UOO93454.1 CAP domain-containing protein [Vitreoscilla stercoraria]